MPSPSYFDHPRALRLTRGDPSRRDWFDDARWSADQRYVASCSHHDAQTGWLDMWDARTGAISASQAFTHQLPTTLAWHADNQTIACGFTDGSVRLWHPQTRRLHSALHLHQRRVDTLAWSAAGDLLLTTSEDATLLWHAQTGRIVWRLQAAAGHGRLAAALHPNGEQMALGASDETLRIINLTSGTTEAVLVDSLTFTPILRWSPSGAYLLYTSQENLLRIWTVRLQKHDAFLQTAQSVRDVSWAGDEETFAAITSGERSSFPGGGHLSVWNRKTNEIRFHREIRRVSALAAVDVAPDGQALVVAGTEGMLAIWDGDGTHFPQLWANVPSAERREELAIWAELNAEQGLPPYYQVRLHSRQEVEWVFQEQDWFSRHIEKPGTGAHPHSARFAGADLHGLDLSGMSFNTSDFSDADLRDANLTACEFNGANLNYARLDGATVVDASFSYAILDNLQCTGLTLTHTRFYEAWIRGATFTRCRFASANIGSANFWECTFAQSDFAGADVGGARFTECTFSGTTFTDADLSHATFERCSVDTPGIFATAKKSEHTTISELLIHP